MMCIYNYRGKRSTIPVILCICILQVINKHTYIFSITTACGLCVRHLLKIKISSSYDCNVFFSEGILAW